MNMTIDTVAQPETDQEALSALVAIILAKGYSVSVNDGGAWPVKKSTDAAEICEAASAVSEATLRLRNSYSATVGEFDLVFGNAPDELITDYSYSPEMNAICDEFQLLFPGE